MKEESTTPASISKPNRQSATRLRRLAADIGQLGNLSDEQVRHLVAELQACQIELQRQNQELRRSRRNLEESRDKYSDLYDFAPVGYLTISTSGKIVEVNMTGATMLAADPQALLSAPFTKESAK